MSSNKGLFERIVSEPHYMVGSVMAVGLVVMTGMAVYTSNRPAPAAEGSVDWADSAGRTNSAAAAEGYDSSNPAMRSYIAKIRDPKNPFPSAQGAMDSTRLLRMGDDMPFDMSNSELKGDGGKPAELAKAGGKTLAEMEALAATGHKTGVRVEKPQDQAGRPPTPEKTAAEGAKETQVKLSNLDKLRRSFSGSSKGEKSLFAGFDIFKGFGNRDGKKKEEQGAHDPSGRGKEKGKGREMSGLARAFGDNAKKNEQWHGNPFGEAGGNEQKDCKGVECAFTNARKGEQEERGERLGGVEGGGGQDGNRGANVSANPGNEAAGGGGNEGDGNLTAQLPTNEQAAEQTAKEEKGPAKEETTAKETPKEDAGPPPKTYLECLKQGKNDCGKAGDWYGAGKHACGFNTPCEPKGDDNFSKQLGGHPNEVCGKDLNLCTVQWTGNGEKYIKVASCPAGTTPVVVPYGGGVYTCVTMSGTKTYTKTESTYRPWEPKSTCPTGTVATVGNWPQVPKSGDKYCK